MARRPSAPHCISLDSKEAAGILRSLAAPAHDPDAHLAMTHAADEMPEAQRALLRSIFTHRDIAATRAASNVSTATFYRDLQELAAGYASWVHRLAQRALCRALLHAPRLCL